MDFFDHEAQARKQTRRLIWLFGLAIIAVMLVNNLILATLVATVTHPVFPNAPRWHPGSIIISALELLGEAMMQPARFFQHILHPQTFCIITFGTLLSISLGSWYKIQQLSKGGSVVAEFLGGRRVEPDTKDLDEQRLRNVIEEMAIASGTSVPEVYVLDNERSINAFAAGHTRDDVAIGVTRGGLKLLTREELQGVIAHEFSHILNGDTRLNMQLIGLAHGLFWPTILGRILIYGTRDGSPVDDTFVTEDGRPRMLPTAPLGILFVIIGCTSLPFVRLIKSAICRQREWLADAAAVQFTRNPVGITGALKKIGGLFKQGRLNSPHAEVASHLYFADFNYTPWFTFLATHPPVAKRVLAIDPAFNGVFPKVQMLRPNQYELDQAFDTAMGSILLAGRILPGKTFSLGNQATNEHLRQAAVMRLGLPPEIHAALRTPAGAAGIIFSLLLNDEDSIRAGQLEILQRNLAPDFYQAILTLGPQIQTLGDRYKFPVAELAVPALRQTTPDAHKAFNQTLQQLVECEGSIGLFEYALIKMVARQLCSFFAGPDLGSTRGGRVQDLLPECALLLSAIAHVGQENEDEARASFAKGLEVLDVRKEKPQFLTRSEWNLTQIDTALTKLAGYHDALRRNVLLACVRTAVANGQVNEREAELLRAIADTFNCPVPPFVDSYRTEEVATDA